MNDKAERPAHIPWPPILFIAALVGSILLGIFVPLPWIPPPLSDILFAIGCLLVAGAVLIGALAIRTLIRHKTTVMPTQPSEHLVTNGPFALSRNPIYLAYVIILFGAGFVSGNLWFMALALACAFAINRLAIAGEEAHLSLRFGKRYRDYSRKVRRWI